MIKIYLGIFVLAAIVAIVLALYKLWPRLESPRNCGVCGTKMPPGFHSDVCDDCLVLGSRNN